MSENLPAIFKEGFDRYFSKINYFYGVDLINMLDNNKKLIMKQVDEAKSSFDKMIEEMRALASSKMKGIFSKKASIEDKA